MPFRILEYMKKKTKKRKQAKVQKKTNWFSGFDYSDQKYEK